MFISLWITSEESFEQPSWLILENKNIFWSEYPVVEKEWKHWKREQIAYSFEIDGLATTKTQPLLPLPSNYWCTNCQTIILIRIMNTHYYKHKYLTIFFFQLILYIYMINMIIDDPFLRHRHYSSPILNLWEWVLMFTGVDFL